MILLNPVHEDPQNIMSSNNTKNNGDKDVATKIVNKILLPHVFYMILLILIMILAG